MKLIINLFILAISFVIPTHKAEAKDKDLCQRLEIEEDTGATIYNSGVTCGGMGR